MEDILETPQFSEVIAALRDTSIPFPSRYLRQFSDLSRTNLKDLMAAWPSIPEDRKVALLEDLEGVMEADTLVNFDSLARRLMTDDNPAIRVLSLRLLWESEESNLVPDLMKLSLSDQDEAVRATAASLLGRFIFLGELEDIKPDLKVLIEDHLIGIVQGKDSARVKQRALESLGYSCNPVVSDLIRDAFRSSDPAWLSSALNAMGRSADEVWAPQVEKMLIAEDPEVKFEAIRAAGELELASSREVLINMLDEEIEDPEIRLALIWTLSQIGGNEVKEKLDDLLTNAADEDEIEWIEKAIENLELSSSERLELLDFEGDDEGADLEDFEEKTRPTRLQDEEEDDYDLDDDEEDDEEDGDFDLEDEAEEEDE